MSDQKPYPRKLTTLFKSGKHAGESLQHVIDTDIDHIEWLWKNKRIAFDGIAWDYFLEKSGAKSEGKVQTTIYKRHHKTKR